MNLKLIILSLLLIFPGIILSAEKRIISYAYYLYINDVDETVNKIRQLTDKHNGYVKHLTGKKIIIRIPVKGVKSVKKTISSLGYINDEQMYSKNISESLAYLNTRLRVKMGMLKNLYKLFDMAQFTQTLAVEKEIGRIIIDVEKIKGTIAYYNEMSQMVELKIFFNQQGRQRRSLRIQTRWNWVRNLGIPQLMVQW